MGAHSYAESLSARARHRASLFAVTLICASLAGTACAQDPAYPVKPLRVLVGFQPGGGSDLLARLIAPKLTERFGQSVVVDNRSGAGGIIALETAKDAPPDGYTLLVISGSQVTNASLFTKVKFDLAGALAPISQLTSEPYILLVRQGFAAGSVKELIALAKAKPGTITCGSSGTGSFAHLGIELFNSLAAVHVMHVPYKGSGQALIDLLGGQIDMTLASAISATPPMKGGKVRAIAVTSARRSPLFPELPTIAEAGVPGYEVASWYGLVAPRGTSAQIIQKLNAELMQILALPEVKANLASSGAIPAPGTPQALASLIRMEITKWRKVVKEAGIRLN